MMAAIGRYLKTQLIYTCHTKQLQAQVVDDFPYAIELKGRSNYPCLKSTKLSCNECTKERGNYSATACKACEYTYCFARPKGKKTKKSEMQETCPCESDCPYIRQKRRAKASELAILNTPFFLNEANFAGDFSGWPWVVLDEGDLTENVLMSFIELSISKATIQRLRLEPPKKTVQQDWIDWAQNSAIPVINSRLGELEKSPGMNPFEIREKKDMERLLDKLHFFINQDLNNWVFLPSEIEWVWKPVFIARYATSRLWDHGKRFFIMSATIISPEQFARDLGLKQDDVEFIDLPSVFPPERRPIHFIPAADMTHRNKEIAWPQVVRAMDKIIAQYPREKGLIHTVSYPLARFVYEHSEHSARFDQHDSKDRTSVLNHFKADPSSRILLSPSMDRGVDLPGDLCRFIIILKIPFPNLGDEQISRRLYSAHDGTLRSAVQTIRSIIQATGRGMRSADDYCETYILDNQFGRIFHDYYNYFPAWWREALREELR